MARVLLCHSILKRVNVEFACVTLMSLSSSVITYTVIWLITCSLSHQKMARTPHCLCWLPSQRATWRLGDFQVMHKYPAIHTMLKNMWFMWFTPGSSSDAHVPVVGTFSMGKQVPACWKFVFWYLCSGRCLLTPFYIFMWCERPQFICGFAPSGQAFAAHGHPWTLVATIPIFPSGSNGYNVRLSGCFFFF